MAEKENKLIKEAKENYDVLTGDDEVKRLAEIRLMSQLEEQAALENAREKGVEKGVKEGLAQGKKEGLAQGKKEGLEQGKKEGLEQGKKEGLEQGKRESTVRIAQKMKEENIDIRTISQITGLTEQEIIIL